MLKEGEIGEKLESAAASNLRELLEQVHLIQIEGVHREERANDRTPDIVVDLSMGGLRRRLVCEFKANGQPRNVRNALLQLRDHIAHSGKDAVPVFIAPYLSPEARAVCREMGSGYLDFEGNAWLVFDGVFIERTVPHAPPTERRQLRSLFKPKSSQVLICLLEDPQREWRVAELAAAAAVSLGHVSNVRAGLLEREWGRVSEKGLSLSQPNALLDAWRAAYRAPEGRRLARYSPLHGSELEKVVRDLLTKMPVAHVVLGSFSAARWLAPYARSATEYFYADEIGVKRLAEALMLTSTAKGENVVISAPKDTGLFRNTVEAAPGALCTSVVQTYLDLTLAGERGREAAEHLRRERLAWPK